ncbi:MAG: hypothetical protein K1X92_12530 [Bacteroidia bacterium]|nr:hypothetical protein [Bacteroidia bacterium]
MKKTVVNQILFFWVCLITFSALNAQTAIPARVSSPIPVKITDSGRLYSTFSLDEKNQFHDEIKKQTGAKVFADILLYSEEGAWPSDISTLDGRNTNRASIGRYKANLVAIFDKDYAILEIPVAGNEGMPSGMRPQKHAIYFVIGKDGVEPTGATYAAASPSGLKKVRIVDSGQLYSTYDIQAETPWHDAIKKVVGENGFQDVVTYSNEKNWPVGISNLDNWRENKLKMNDYTVYLLVGNLDGKVILYCPAGENQYMPSDLKPSRDIYFVMGLNGIEGDGISQSNPSADDTEVEDTNGKDVRMAQIDNPMELYSTFEIEENENAMEVYQEIFGDEYRDRAIELSTEEGWPSGISTFSARDLVREEFKDYNVYYLGEFMATEPVAILYVALDENMHMPENMQPLDEDGFILLFKKSAVTIGESIGVEEITEKPSADNFETQLNTLLEGLKDDFKNIKGNQIVEKEGGLASLSKEYQSRIVLDGSEKTVIRENLGFNYSAQAYYGSFRSKEEAMDIYHQLVQKVEKASLTCCSFVQDEQDLENIITTSWIPFDLSGKMDTRLKDIVMEVRVIKLLGIDDNFKSFDEYSVSLSVYHQK